MGTPVFMEPLLKYGPFVVWTLTRDYVDTVWWVV